jgi:hypothetical protein
LDGGVLQRPTEVLNLLIKKVKRVGRGFRNLTNNRLRLLLRCGLRWQTHRTARLRRRPTLGGVALPSRRQKEPTWLGTQRLTGRPWSR